MILYSARCWVANSGLSKPARPVRPKLRLSSYYSAAAAVLVIAKGGRSSIYFQFAEDTLGGFHPLSATRSSRCEGGSTGQTPVHLL